MKLFDAIEKFCQLATAPTESDIPSNAVQQHIINIFENSEELLDYTDRGIALQTIKPETKRFVQDLHNFAIRATQNRQNIEELKPLIDQMIGIYDTIIGRYIDRRYPLIEEIGESLSYTKNNL